MDLDAGGKEKPARPRPGREPRPLPGASLVPPGSGSFWGHTRPLGGGWAWPSPSDPKSSPCSPREAPEAVAREPDAQPWLPRGGQTIPHPQDVGPRRPASAWGLETSTVPSPDPPKLLANPQLGLPGSWGGRGVLGAKLKEAFHRFLGQGVCLGSHASFRLASCFLC